VRFSDWAVGRKLTVLFTLVACLALMVFAGVLWLYESRANRNTLQREISALAETLADSSAVALAFQDDKSAAETLGVLRAEPSVVAACLYREDGFRAATYPAQAAGSRCPRKAGPDRTTFDRGNLIVVRTARLRGEVTGQLWLSVGLADLYQQLRHLGLICGAVLAFSLLFAAGLAAFLQRLISGPILDLAGVAGRVSEQGDYSIRATRRSKDELGVLVDRFNAMMEQVDQRDIALEQAQSDLERRVRERTRELRDEIATRRLVEQDLLNAKEVAEESNRSKSAFLANMSHELRTPLNAIIGYSELLREDAVDEGAESAVSDLTAIVNAGKHLLSLINDILDLSKIEAGRMELYPEPALVKGLVGDVATTIQPLAWKNSNEFVTSLPEDDYLVSVDAIRFRQSLLNLLSNACKFTEHGKVSLEVNRQVEGDTAWICFSVQDTGPGIAAEDIGKLFKTFSQVDSSATRKHGGSGLGLAISRRFCQMMGGDISVASRPGKGSTFTIRMPEAQFEAVAPE